MTYRIRYEISNQINFESPGIIEDEGNTFPHIFGNKEFSFDVTFFANNDIYGDFGDVEVANTITSSFPDFVNVQPISSSTVRISKAANTSLFEEGYSFSVIDANTLTQETQSVDISEVQLFDKTNKALISWDTPPDETANSNAMEVGQFVFTINDGINSNNTISFDQTYFWSPEEGFGYFQDIISEL